MIPLRDANPVHGRPYLTWALVAVNVLVFLYTLSLTGRAQLEFVFEMGFVPGLFARSPGGEVTSLFTSLFLHGGWGHLLSNMIFLVVFGDNVEDRLGRLGFLVFYLAGGAFATLAHSLFAGSSLVPLIGASGSISAVLGAYFAFFPRQRIQTFVPPLLLPWLIMSFLAPVPRFFMWWLPAWVFIGYWALLQVFQAGASLGAPVQDGGVAWWAHVGGFLFGLAWTYLLASPRRDARA